MRSPPRLLIFALSVYVLLALVGDAESFFMIDLKIRWLSLCLFMFPWSGGLLVLWLLVSPSSFVPEQDLMLFGCLVEALPTLVVLMLGAWLLVVLRGNGTSAGVAPMPSWQQQPWSWPCTRARVALVLVVVLVARLGPWVVDNYYANRRAYSAGPAPPLLTKAGLANVMISQGAALSWAEARALLGSPSRHYLGDRAGEEIYVYLYWDPRVGEQDAVYVEVTDGQVTTFGFGTPPDEPQFRRRREGKVQD